MIPTSDRFTNQGLATRNVKTSSGLLGAGLNASHTIYDTSQVADMVRTWKETFDIFNEHCPALVGFVNVYSFVLSHALC